MSGDNAIVLGLGAFFIVVGVVLLLFGSREEKGYYNALAGKRDLREFVTHNPVRPEPGSLRTGGWISVAIGVLVVVLGLLFGS
ncbi:hypothetical protein ABFB09_06020 [Dehalogenimonas sp. THU2]|uniref:hypothetical protein n=1 Tax=Dehalogenimonas sp. THU2 TaxID=3151121 RepID=UPI003218D706